MGGGSGRELHRLRHNRHEVLQRIEGLRIAPRGPAIWNLVGHLKPRDPGTQREIKRIAVFLASLHGSSFQRVPMLRKGRAFSDCRSLGYIELQTGNVHLSAWGLR